MQTQTGKQERAEVAFVRGDRAYIIENKESIREGVIEKISGGSAVISFSWGTAKTLDLKSLYATQEAAEKALPHDDSDDDREQFKKSRRWDDDDWHRRRRF